MKVEMFVSPRTFASFEKGEELLYSVDEELYPIEMRAEIRARDWLGYLLVNGEYKGTYKLNVAQKEHRKKKREFK